ncbi:hypothetical protein [Microvirga rosea]|uniref:hypothetical protein n=1 Tax=Microvirga rosea TaxID=2715425 RepID=UPI001D09A089|nr:hypothetical protein [Microvirga rosea]MCB8821282.1 hypothetical protein [Microvirga rosea]
MPKIDVAFIFLSVVCLMIGLVLGIGMGASHNFQLAPVHAHLNLLGWASLALFGLIYRAYPALTRSWLAKLHLWLSGVAALAFPAGIYVSITYEKPMLAILMSLVALAGVITFFLNLIRVFFFVPEASATESPARSLA